MSTPRTAGERAHAERMAVLAEHERWRKELGERASAERDRQLASFGELPPTPRHAFEFSAKLSDTRVRMTAFAHESLRDWGFGTGFEVGGWGIGWIDEGEIVIANVWNVGEFCGSQRDRFAFEHNTRQTLEEHAQRGGYCIVASIHSHEIFEPNGVCASNGDRRFWAGTCRDLNRPHAGLIVAPKTDTSSAWAWYPRPLLQGWLASEAAGTVTIQPLTVTVESSS